MQTNIAIMAQQFQKSSIIQKIGQEPEMILAIASKISAASLHTAEKLKEAMQEDQHSYELIKKNNFYNINRTLNWHRLESFLRHQKQTLATKILAGQVILFGIKNFKKELTETLRSFSESTCFKTLVTASTTSKIIFNRNKNETTEKLNRKTVDYQRRSLEALTSIARLSGITIDTSGIKNLPDEIITIPKDFITFVAIGSAILTATATIGILGILGMSYSYLKSLLAKN